MQVGQTMTRNVDNVLPGISPNQQFSMGDIGPGGIDYVRRIRVYTSQGGTLIADSDIPNPAGRMHYLGGTTVRTRHHREGVLGQRRNLVAYR